MQQIRTSLDLVFLFMFCFDFLLKNIISVEAKAYLLQW